MIEVKEQSGYSKANVSGQNLSGSVPVIDLSRGGLKSAFAAFAAKEKSPLEAGAKDNKAQNKPAEAKAEQPARDDQDKQPEAKNPDASRQNENTTQEPAKLEQTGYTPPQAFAPKFAPTIAAGALSMVQQKAAQRPKASYEDPDHETEADVFNLGKRSTKRVQKGILDDPDNGYGSNSANKSDELMQNYAQWQQQQAFMQTVEYAAALSVTNEHIERLEQRAGELRIRVAEIQTERDELAAEVAQGQQQIDQKEDRIAGLEEVAAAQAEHKADLKKEDEMWAKNDAIMQEAYAPQRNTVKIIGKDTFVTVTEDGKPTLYKVGEDGQKVKVEDKDRPFFDPFQDTYYSRKTPDGKTEYLNGFGQPVSQQEKEKIDNALKATGAKPEEALADRDEMIKKQDAAMELARSEGVGDGAMWEQGKITESSKKRMDAAAAEMKIPQDRMDRLEEIIQDERNELSKLREEQQKKVDSLKGKDKELQAAKDELAAVEEDMVEAHKFRTRLERGEFKNEAEMVKAMPETMRDDYEDKKKRELAATAKDPSNNAQAAAPQASSQTTAKLADEKALAQQQGTLDENTSRPTGSASPSTIATSTKDVTNQYNAASTGTPPPANEPAPVADKELVAAANTPKASTAAGMSI